MQAKAVGEKNQEVIWPGPNINGLCFKDSV